VRTVVTVAPPADGSAWTGRTRALPLSVGRATRTIPPHIRTALNLRDSGLPLPGVRPARQRGLMATTSCTGRTVGVPRSTISSRCADRTTAACTSRGGAFTSPMESQWWSRRPDGSAARLGAFTGAMTTSRSKRAHFERESGTRNAPRSRKEDVVVWGRARPRARPSMD